MTYSLTQLQLAIMTVLWERGEASVLDIHDALRAERRLAQSTVSTLLTRLEEKGVVAHRLEGRQNMYRALVPAEQVRRSVVKEFSELTGRLFSGDTAGLISHVLAEHEVQPEDLARVRRILEEKERELRAGESHE